MVFRIIPIKKDSSGMKLCGLNSQTNSMLTRHSQSSISDSGPVVKVSVLLEDSMHLATLSTQPNILSASST